MILIYLGKAHTEMEIAKVTEYTSHKLFKNGSLLILATNLGNS